MNTFKVKLTRHAQLDAIPLRYGVLTEQFIKLEEIQHDAASTQRQKPVEIAAGNQHYIADAYDEHHVFVFRGRFVLKPLENAEADYLAITVLPVTQSHADRGVSDIVRSQRESGHWCPEFIRDTLFPLYSSDQLSDSTALFNKLVELAAESRMNDSNIEITRFQNLIKDHESRVLELERENEEYKEKIVSLEKGKPDYANEDLEVTSACTLSAVDRVYRTKRDGARVECVRLIFSENVPDRIMDVGFDQSGAIFEKACSLVGSQVRTVTWRPQFFKPMKWFRDIYPA